MTVEAVYFLVEGPSMEAFLRIVAPKILCDVAFEVYAYNGKPDLLRKLPSRLAGYRAWLPATHRIVVVVDRDQQDCTELKTTLEAIAGDAGLVSRSARQKGDAYQVLTRIAIEELEAWYFGDWVAVRAAYPRVPAGVVRQRRYRDPDGIVGGTAEAFERVLNEAGYFAHGLRKIEAAREVAHRLVPKRNTSRSFRCFRDGLAELASESEGA